MVKEIINRPLHKNDKGVLFIVKFIFHFKKNHSNHTKAFKNNKIIERTALEQDNTMVKKHLIQKPLI